MVARDEFSNAGPLFTLAARAVVKASKKCLGMDYIC
jgi:hypothetical protein